MDTHGTSWDIMGHHGTSWDITGHHGTSWHLSTSWTPPQTCCTPGEKVTIPEGRTKNQPWRLKKWSPINRWLIMVYQNTSTWRAIWDIFGATLSLSIYYIYIFIYVCIYSYTSFSAAAIPVLWQDKGHGANIVLRGVSRTTVLRRSGHSDVWTISIDNQLQYL